MLSLVPAANAQNRLLVSELLYQPLAGEAEYVELYNADTVGQNLGNYHIVRWIGDSLGRHYPLPDYVVAPHDYVVLTKDVSSVLANFQVKYVSKLVECDLPPYPNDGGSVILASAESVVVERFDYLPDMHSRLLRKKNGVSLERRSFEVAANVALNWFSASSMSGYGTPGYENSQSLEYLAEESLFEFSSSIVSPDGDGYNDELVIDYELDMAELLARCEIYDSQGRLVCRLLNNDLLGTHGTIVWNGRDNSGMSLAQGQYVLVLTLFDTAGTKQVIKRAVALVYR